mgnify:CR=1 FL=1
MKPRTKFQQSVVAASKHLPPLTPAQIEWGYKNCIEHIGRRTPKGLITCTECGHTWQSENGELTDNLLGCECPHCHTTLKVETTLRRKFNDYEYFVHRNPLQGVFKSCASSISSVGRKWDRHPFTPISKPYSGGIAPDGRSATFARLRPMGFFVHGWSWSSALELRAENDGKYNITPTRIYPRQRLIPELRRSGYGKQLPDVTLSTLSTCCSRRTRPKRCLKRDKRHSCDFSPVPPAISPTIGRPSVSPSVTGTLSGKPDGMVRLHRPAAIFRERPA